MKKDQRRDERFNEMGRVESQNLCVFPGILDDISMTGCRVHFPIPVDLDMDNDYTLNIKFSASNSNSMEMICKPQWKHTGAGCTEIGFSFLRSPDTPDLTEYVNNLKGKSLEEDDLIFSSEVVFC